MSCCSVRLCVGGCGFGGYFKTSIIKIFFLKKSLPRTCISDRSASSWIRPSARASERSRKWNGENRDIRKNNPVVSKLVEWMLFLSSRSISLCFLRDSANPLHLTNEKSLPSLLHHSLFCSVSPHGRQIKPAVSSSIRSGHHSRESVTQSWGSARPGVEKQEALSCTARRSGVNDTAFPSIWQDATLPRWWINMDLDMGFGWSFR